MNHDPLCPVHALTDVPLDGRPIEHLFCDCEFIRQIREDERAKQ